jgi:hypothetical protein
MVTVPVPLPFGLVASTPATAEVSVKLDGVLMFPKLYSVFLQERNPTIVINKTATIYLKLFFIIVVFIKLI